MRVINVAAAAATVLLIVAKILYAIAILHECDRLTLRSSPQNGICSQRVERDQVEARARPHNIITLREGSLCIRRSMSVLNA